MRRVVNTITCVFAGKMHGSRLKTVSELTYALLGCARMTGASVGRQLAMVTRVKSKSAIHRVCRFIGNANVTSEEFFETYVPWVVGKRRSLLVSLDWTIYGITDDHRIAVNVITKHGRATPLIWKVHPGSRIKRRRGRYERQVLKELKALLGEDVDVTVLADRGFSDTAFFSYIAKKLHWNYVIRTKANYKVTMADGRTTTTGELVPRNGKIKHLHDVYLTAKEAAIAGLICLKRKAMKEEWILVTNLRKTSREIVNLYGRRFTCEEHFRDEKDDRFGLGSKEARLSSPERRERFLILVALATVILTLLGAAGEHVGYDKQLKANTSKKRTHSLFRQGREYFQYVHHSMRDHLHFVFFKLVSKISENAAVCWVL